jgi:hypothetical protein
MEHLYTAEEAKKDAYKHHEKLIRESINHIKHNVSKGTEYFSGTIAEMDILQSKLIELGYDVTRVNMPITNKSRITVSWLTT